MSRDQTNIVLLHQKKQTIIGALLAKATRNQNRAAMDFLRKIFTDNSNHKLSSAFLRDQAAPYSTAALGSQISRGEKVSVVKELLKQAGKVENIQVTEFLLDQMTNSSTLDDAYAFLKEAVQQSHKLTELVLGKFSKFRSELLDRAIKHGDTEVAGPLLDQMTNSSTLDDAYAFLKEAVQQSHKLTELVLGKLSEQLKFEGERGKAQLEEAFDLAIGEGLSDVVDLLLSKVQDPVSYQGKILLNAVQQGRHAIVESMLEKGADVNILDGDQKTPLMWASYWQYLIMVNGLLSLGADVSFQDNDGNTALIHAINHQEDLDGGSKDMENVVSLLLAYEARVGQPNLTGKTPLSLASQKGYAGVVQLLEHYAADDVMEDASELDISSSGELDITIKNLALSN